MAYETITVKDLLAIDDFESDFEMSESASLTTAPYQFEPVLRISSSVHTASSSSYSEDE